MPNDSPRPDFMIKLERQRSHLSLSKASLRGLDVLVTGAGGAVADVLELDSDIVHSVRVSAQARSSVD